MMSVEAMCDELNRINRRWEAFYREKIGWLRYFAGGDEDLISIGLVSVGELLHRKPDCPEGWLVNRAKYDMISAVRRKKPEYPHESGRSDRFNADRASRRYERVQYGAMDTWRRRPEVRIHDKLQFQAFWNDLDGQEKRLLIILKEEMGDPQRYKRWKDIYCQIGRREKGRAKRRFLAEVSPVVKHYVVSFANLRFKFYRHFGTEDEFEREENWYAQFDPFKRLHFDRNGYYDRPAR